MACLGDRLEHRRERAVAIAQQRGRIARRQRRPGDRLLDRQVILEESIRRGIGCETAEGAIALRDVQTTICT